MDSPYILPDFHSDHPDLHLSAADIEALESGLTSPEPLPLQLALPTDSPVGDDVHGPARATSGSNTPGIGVGVGVGLRSPYPTASRTQAQTQAQARDQNQVNAQADLEEALNGALRDAAGANDADRDQGDIEGERDELTGADLDFLPDQVVAGLGGETDDGDARDDETSQTGDEAFGTTAVLTGVGTSASHALNGSKRLTPREVSALSSNEKRQRTRDSNRKAAEKSRAKKRRDLGATEQNVAALQKENEQLRARLAELKGEAPPVVHETAPASLAVGAAGAVGLGTALAKATVDEAYVSRLRDELVAAKTTLLERYLDLRQPNANATDGGRGQSLLDGESARTLSQAGAALHPSPANQDQVPGISRTSQQQRTAIEAICNLKILRAEETAMRSAIAHLERDRDDLGQSRLVLERLVQAKKAMEGVMAKMPLSEGPGVEGEQQGAEGMTESIAEAVRAAARLPAASVGAAGVEHVAESGGQRGKAGVNDSLEGDRLRERQMAEVEMDRLNEEDEDEEGNGEYDDIQPLIDQAVKEMSKS